MQGGGQEEDVTVMARGGVQDDDHSCIVDRSACAHEDDMVAGARGVNREQTMQV